MNPIPQQKKMLNKNAIAWLRQFSQEMDADLDLIDAMPIEEVRAELRTLGAASDAFHVKLATTLQTAKRKRISKPLREQITKKFEKLSYELRQVANEFWEPTYAGQLVTSADIPKQQHRFTLDDGSLTIECSWSRARGKKPAYIWLTWQAEVATDRELQVVFLDPETQTIRYTAKLGKLRLGEATFTATQLGFDPSCERWAIIIG